ncbi:MAG: SDR family oxidoreductase [Ktedonobacteraceae bacterium]
MRTRRSLARRETRTGDIALVAMTGRFPGATSVEQFWHNLQAGQESITFFSEAELLAAGVPAELVQQPNYVRARPILPEEVVSGFDAAFFGYSPREAQLLDPQHRLFLECCWEALERAGYDPQGYEGLIGVFGGTNVSSYLHQLLRNADVVQSMQDVVNGYQIAISMDKDSLTTAVSYKLNLRGPSLAVQTFCSTSLVAVHLACQSLRRGECDMVLAGGVSVHVPVIEGHLYEEGGQESPDGHCRTFDARAGGSMFGDGVGVVVLKRLEEALEDGDQVVAVIRGSAINNDGAGKVSYTAPSVVGQAEVVLAALEDAGVNAESISYVEAHGTATTLGDPIEVASLTRAYRSQTEAVGYCAIGSVKTNIGHLDRAAGVSGLIKTVLALQAEALPATLHYEQPNPEIDFAHSPFVVNAALQAWPRRADRPRRAGINSLGMGGTNAHVIVEEAPERVPSGPSRPWQVLPLSARTQEALERATEQLGDYLREHEDLPFADVAYTLQVGRRAMKYRRMVVCQDREAAVKLLQGNEGKRLPFVQQEHRDREVAFLFPGVGEQFAEQAIELYRQETTFRNWVDQCCGLLKPSIGCDLREVLFTIDQTEAYGHGNVPKLDLLILLQDESYRKAAIEAATKRLQQITFAEPATFILEYALARLLMQSGIQPKSLLGTGSGEYVAACLAGVFSLKDALMLLACRAQLLAGGGANLHDMQGAQLVELARSIALHPPTIPYLSMVTGTWISDEEATDAGYWGRHLCEPMRLTDGVAHLLDETAYVLLEVGAGQTLSSFVRQHPTYKPDQSSRVVATLPEEAEQKATCAQLLTALGKLWLMGVTPDWYGLYTGEHRQRVLLPTYPFEHKRYWLEPARPTIRRAQAPEAQPQIARLENPADWFYQEHWQPTPRDEQAVPALRYPWLVLLDETGLGERLAAGLRQQGYPVTCVEAGSAFARLDAEHFHLRTGEPADYVRLLQILASEGRLPRRVLYGWSVSAEPQRPSAATLRAHEPSSFFGLVSLARTLSEHALDEPLALYVLSTNAQRVLAEDLVQPEHALAAGACLVIAQEPLNLACRCIDLSWEAGTASGWQDDALIDLLLGECTGLDEELQVAYRQGVRWGRSYVRHPLPEASSLPVILREQGVYLLTGGLGGIGLALAEDLATRYRAKLVLLSRRVLPQHEEWENWLAEHETQAEHQAVSQILRRLQGIEEHRGVVLVIQADVSVAEQVQAAVDLATITFGALHGVFHLAGVVDERYSKSVQDIQQEDCDIHFQAKGAGTAMLGEVLAGCKQKPDFVLLFSSLSATLGGLGFVAYTAANRYLDAYAHWANQQEMGRWLSVGWDTWLVRENTHGNLGRTIAAFAMTPQEGLEALQRVLASGESHLVQSTGDLFARLQQWVHTDLLHEHHSNIQRGQQIKQTTVAIGVALSRIEVEQCIRQIWQEVLGLEEIGEHEPFFEIGGNSLIALQVISKLKKTLHRPVPAVALFEAPTINLLTTYLAPLVPAFQEVSQQEHLRARRNLARQQASAGELAIVGMSGRFPGATSIEQFWQNLHTGQESITFFTSQELEAVGISPEIFQASNYVPARPVLPTEVVEGFDAALFGYSPREAELTDPQHRLFLECAWEVLERAGYDPQEYAGSIGVFGGTNLSTYLLSAEPGQLAGVNDYQLLAGNDKDSLTSSVSYKLNLRGPSLAVQTFCSTSLVAVHLACQSLRRGECDLALAGGASIRVPSVGGHLYEPGSMESPDGHCRTFDARAQGSMFGDGVGIVMLKRLAEALEDGDQILAVIRGSAINNDGATKVSYAAPSVVGQAEVVLAALEDAGVSAESISYVEAHGTATELGDPIEVASLTKAYRNQTEAVGYCAIGSVKTNIGHLDRAAGVSGLIKTVLALQAEALPATLHYEQPNPEIDFVHSPFVVNAALRAWPRQAGRPRRAGINSLGMGGTNAHVIVEEAPECTPSGPSRPWQLLPISGRSEQALEQVRSNLAAHLREHEEVPLADVAYTLQCGRKRLEQRAVLVCRDRKEALVLLEGEGKLLARRQEQRTERPVAFVFPGVGEQYVGMTQQLYEREAVFQEQLDHCCRLLEPHLGLDLRTLLFAKYPEPPQNHGQNEGTSRRLLFNGRSGTERENYGQRVAGELGRTELGQPALFVVSYALARLLMSWGIRPQAMLGYSVGEYVAACISGVLSLEDALRLVAQRARWISEQPIGAMLAVALGEREVASYLEEGVSVAISVSPSSSVLGGSVEAVARVRQRLEQGEIACRQVESSHAFHTPQLAILQERVTELASTLKRQVPSIPYLSNVTGTWITAEQTTDASYWARHLCEPVRFSQGVETLLEAGEYVIVEVGPGQALSSFVRQHPRCSREQMALVIASSPMVHERQGEQEYLVQMMGKLWLCGARIDWAGYAAGEQRQRVLLPTYPFERQRYWLESRKQSNFIPNVEHHADPEVPRSADLTNWFYGLTWKQALQVKRHEEGNIQASKQQQWLVFADAQGIGIQVANQLRGKGMRVRVVLPGNSFASLDAETYTVRPAERSDYAALLKDLRLQHSLPDHIAHLWLVTAECTQVHESVPEESWLERGFYSLLALAQALGDLDIESCEIAVISSEIHAVLGNEHIHPIKATLLGFCRVIPQEYANLYCRNIDLVLPEVGSWHEESLVQQLIRELLTSARDVVVALRGERRWVQAFEPLPLSKDEYADVPWRAKGVYLLTGGLGGIALEVASLLARTVQARLVLLNRSGLPPQEQWSDLLQQEPESVQAGRIRKIEMLEALGSEVLVLQADVANEQQMRVAYQQIQEHFGELHGVFHLAGVPGVGLTQLKRREQAAEVLAPKVQGTLVLQRVLEDQPLDFLVLFSSVTSTTGGGPGQIDYSSANAFLDAVAQREQQQGRRVFAIDWGEWQWNAWEAGLSGYGIEAQKYLREHRQRFGISFEEGTEALQRILASNLSHVVVSTQDFRVIAEQSRNFTAAEVLQRTREQRRTLYARPDLVSSYITPHSVLEQRIATLWEDLLGVTPIGVNDNFFELGGNSLLGIDLIARLRKMHNYETLAAYVLYEAPTVGTLAHYLEQDKTEATSTAVDERLARGKRRRDGLKQLINETRRTRV